MVNRSKVLVVWHDAHSGDDGWHTAGEIDSEPCVVESVGWLLPDAKAGHVVVVQSVLTHDESIDGVLCVPVGMVVSVQIL